MKKILNLLLISMLCGLCYTSAIAQSNVCTPVDTFKTAGLYPEDSSLPCIVKGIWNEFVVQFKNYDSVANPLEPGTELYLDSITIESISNLPCGYAWALNLPYNTIPANGNGCLAVAGSTNDTAGQYALNINILVYFGHTGEGVPYTSQQLGLSYIIRVVDSANAVCPAIDSAGAVAVSSCDSTAFTGISQVASKNILGLNNFPNPYTGNTDIVFGAMQEKEVTFTVYDVLGQMVHSEKYDAVAGKNTIQFDGSKLGAGVYLYSISDGTNTATNRMVIGQ